MSKLIQFVNKDTISFKQSKNDQQHTQTPKLVTTAIDSPSKLMELPELQTLSVGEYCDVSIQLAFCDPGPDDSPWENPPPRTKAL